MWKFFALWLVAAVGTYSWVCLSYQNYFWPPKWVDWVAGLSFLSIPVSLMGLIIVL